MNREKAIEYAAKKIPTILPLEIQDVRDLCNDILDSNKSLETIADAFLSILGQDDLTFQFITGFNEILNSKSETPQPVALSDKETLAETKSNLPANSESFKNVKTETIGTSTTPIDTSLGGERNESSRVEKKISIRNNKVSNAERGTKTSMNAKPIIESVTSEKLDPLIQTKPFKKSTKFQKQQTPKQRKLKSLKEIDDVVNFLSMTYEEKNATKFKCTCEGKRHPIFSIAPNCLSCGKIICVKEGFNLTHCSFCNTELLSAAERSLLIEALKDEENDLNENLSTNQSFKTKKQLTKTYKISTGMGKNLFDQQDKLFDYLERQKERERKREQVLQEENKENASTIKSTKTLNKGEVLIDEDLKQAQERLNKLLHFQETSAERTKVIDNASDFSISTDVGLWGNARERALMLKKQQRNLRKWEKLERERNGRREKYVVSMDIGSDGKVVMKENVKNYGTVYANSDDDFNEISDIEDAEDLKEIQNHKDYLSKERELDQEQLQSKVWDYEENQKQFKKAVYVDNHDSDSDSGSESDGNKDDDKSELKEWRSRVQINTHDAESLEANILAVL